MIVERLCARFRPDAINLLMAHTHLQGALISGSERQVHLGEEWSATPQALPADAHYIALGHIHRGQRVDAAPSPTFYAGSPLQLDFGEGGEEKSFVVVDARPGQPARIERIPYQGGKALRSIRMTLEEIERDRDGLLASGWLRVVVPIEGPDPEINGRVRRLLPNAVSVDVDLERPEPEREALPSRDAPPVEMYRSYHIREHASEPDSELVRSFEELYEAERES
jgi:exonuclease SbcD